MAASRLAFPCLLLATCTGAFADRGEIVFVAATNHYMPLSRFQNGVMVEGLLKDLGDSIAQRMGLEVRYVSAPAKRVAEFVQSGRADGVCYVLPHWLQGSFNWSQPLIPDSSVLVARLEAPRVRSLPDLANKPVGTVLGYTYVSPQSVLGPAFLREDAPSEELNMSKIQHGRMQYAIMGRMNAEYMMRSAPQARLRIDFEFEPLKTQCAFSQKSAIPFGDIERAIGSLVADGSIERMMQRYGSPP